MADPAAPAPAVGPVVAAPHRPLVWEINFDYNKLLGDLAKLLFFAFLTSTAYVCFKLPSEMDLKFATIRSEMAEVRKHVDVEMRAQIKDYKIERGLTDKSLLATAAEEPAKQKARLYELAGKLTQLQNTWDDSINLQLRNLEDKIFTRLHAIENRLSVIETRYEFVSHNIEPRFSAQQTQQQQQQPPLKLQSSEDEIASIRTLLRTLQTEMTALKALKTEPGKKPRGTAALPSTSDWLGDSKALAPPGADPVLKAIQADLVSSMEAEFKRHEETAHHTAPAATPQEAEPESFPAIPTL